MASLIAHNASIDPRAEIDDEVEIGAFCVIGPHVRIGRGTKLESHVTLMGRVTIGQNNHIFPGAVIGGHPQDISYRGSDTQVVIGDHNVIREGVTINRATEKEDGVTTVGSHNFLMACCHVAHDCRLGDHIIIANGTLLGGHVHVQDHASLSGAVAIHHYASVGSYSFVGGCSRVLLREARAGGVIREVALLVDQAAFLQCVDADAVDHRLGDAVGLARLQAGLFLELL